MAKKSPKSVLSKAFVDNHETVDESTAGELIVAAAQQIRSIKEERDADEKLSAAKALVQDMNAAYGAAIKYEQAKIEFLLEKIAEIQGGTVNPTSGANP
jgi:hypothetical protein